MHTILFIHPTLAIFLARRLSWEDSAVAMLLFVGALVLVFNSAALLKGLQYYYKFGTWETFTRKGWIINWTSFAVLVVGGLSFWLLS